MDTRRAPPLNQAAFIVAIGLELQERESLTLVTGITETTDCEGNFTMTACDYVSAIGDYNITIEDGAVTFDDPGIPTIVAVANNTAVNHTINPSIGCYDSTLGGIAALFYLKWGDGMSYLNVNGTMQALATNTGVDQLYVYNSDQLCPSFHDPRDDMIARLNTLMVYFGFAASKSGSDFLASHTDSGIEVNRTTTGYRIGTENQYHTDLRFFVAAIIVELVCVALVAPTYWNWWKLGRAVSFSPLEIAKAFESPLLVDCNSNFRGRDMAGKANGTPVQYGVLASGNQAEKETRLAFADPQAVQKPKSGMLIDT